MKTLEDIQPTARRTQDLLLALAGALLVALVLLIAEIPADSRGTSDPEELRALISPSLMALVAGAANLTVLVLISVTAVERLLRKQLRQLVRGIVAGICGYGITGMLNSVVLAAAGPEGLPEVLVASDTHSVFTIALHAYIAAAVAYVGALAPDHVPRVRTAMWLGITVTAISVLFAGITTTVSLLLTIAVGLTCATGTSYTVGMSQPASVTGQLVQELRRFGLEPLEITPSEDDQEGNQHLSVDTVDRRLDIMLMHANDTARLGRRLLGIAMLRQSAAPPVLLGLRRRVEHAALLESAARSAGAAVPRLLAIGELGPQTAVLVREHRRVRSLDNTTTSDITEESLGAIWHELDLLHRHRIAHNSINGDTLGWQMNGRPTFLGVYGGSLAAAPLKASLDVAALLTVLAMRVGAERAVRSAVRVLGVSPVAGVLPFVQPTGLPLALRRRLAAHPHLLSSVREQIALIAPEAPARPARIERMRPRTVASVIAATVVGIIFVYQLADVDFSTITGAEPGWASAAFAASLVCMLAAAMALMGFVPLRLGLWRTVLVQYAASFLRIAAPASVGALALNTRYVTQSGASAGVAIAAVGLSQAVGLLVHVPLLLVCAYLTGTDYVADFSPSVTVIVVSAVLSVLSATVLLLPALRRAILERLRPYFRGVLPQLLDLLQRPGKLAMGVGGTLLLTVGFVLCLYFSVAAFGGNTTVAAVAVVFLAGNAIGSAAPSPGGLGAVEAALLGGLTTVASVPAAIALPAVLLFRVLTFWLPVLPGWGAFHLLQRWRAI